MTPILLLEGLALGAIGGALIWHDARSFLLPNALNAALFLSGLVFLLAGRPERFPEHLAATLLGYAVLAAVAAIYRRLRARDGLGAGDAKLMAASGIWVGAEGLAYQLSIGAMTALCVYAGAAALAGRPLSAEAKVPLGVFLVLGLWVTWVAQRLGYL